MKVLKQTTRQASYYFDAVAHQGLLQVTPFTADLR